MHPEFDYDLVDTPKGLLILADDLREACLKRYGLAGTTVVDDATARRSSASLFRHPF